MLGYYQELQQAYGWTVKEIDETPLEILIDQAIVMAKMSEAERRPIAYIDEVLPL